MLRFTILFFFLLSIGLNAQNRQSIKIDSKDSIIVHFSPTIGKVYYHKMSAKETVFSLAQTFGQHLRDLEVANPGLDLNKLALGAEIKIPFLSTSLVKHSSEMVPGATYRPVFYKTVAKDNFFRIARTYFNQSIENLLDINKMESYNLQVGQLIQVGWIDTNTKEKMIPQINEENQVIIKEESKLIATNTIPTETKAEGNLPALKTVQKSEEKEEEANMLSKLKKTFGIKSKKKDIKEVVMLSEQLEAKPDHQEPEERKKILAEIEEKRMETEVSKIKVPLSPIDSEKILDRPTDAKTQENIPVVKKPEIVIKNEKGIAIWNQSSSDSKNLFALHATAKVGTFIEITNPMMNKTVQAKVIGNIPPRTYTDDVSLVISPRVAKVLGVVDRRFMVKIKYQESI